MGDVHTAGDTVHVPLKYRHNGVQFPLHLKVPAGQWPEYARLLNGAYPLGVKVVCGIFAFTSGKEFSVAKGALLNVLGLSLKRSGSHRTEDYKRVNRIFGFCECLYLPTYEERDKKRGKILSGHEQFLLRTSIPVTNHYSSLDYRIGGELSDRYGWLDKRWLTEDANRHPYAVLLYPFLVWQWERGWYEHRGAFKWNVPAILRGIGAPGDFSNPKNRRRRTEAFARGLDYLHKQGYTGRVEFSAGNGKTYVSVEAPDGHPVRTLRRRSESA